MKMSCEYRTSEASQLEIRLSVNAPLNSVPGAGPCTCKDTTMKNRL